MIISVQCNDLSVNHVDVTLTPYYTLEQKTDCLLSLAEMQLQVNTGVISRAHLINQLIDIIGRSLLHQCRHMKVTVSGPMYH